VIGRQPTVLYVVLGWDAIGAPLLAAHTRGFGQDAVLMFPCCAIGPAVIGARRRQRDRRLAGHRRVDAVGVVFDGFHPDRYDYAGALLCLAGAGVLMYAPR
jgi:hypothetical protein